MLKQKHIWLIAGFVILLISAMVFMFLDSRKLHQKINQSQATTLTQQQSPAPSKASALAAVTAPLPVSERLKGADLSHWDGTIDWVALKKTDLKFLFIKATQGTTYIDPDFEDNWQTAANYGFYRGAYHFYQPNEDAKAQAEHFLSVVKHQKGDILPVLDIEIAHGVSPQALGKDIGIWLETVKSSIGRYPIIYTDSPFWNESIDGNFSQYPLWIATWDQGIPPNLPKGWQRWMFWQYSSTGSIPGIPDARGKVDLDYFYGNEESLRSHLIR